MDSQPLSGISKNRKMPAWKNISFFESYFSNFIEGTEFEVDEAAEIIFEGKMPKDRPQDAHDILGTYQLLSSREEMFLTPKTYEDFIVLLKNRHKIIMSSRPTVAPGEF
jgi:predicted nucleotidyltransferase component of viral defense system